MKNLLSFCSLIALLMLMIQVQSCSEETTTPQNQKPQIQNLSANPSTIKVNGETALNCVATDPDGDNLTISWSSLAGTFPSGNVGATVTWKAPANIGNYIIVATVSDGKETGKDSIDVVVGTEPSAPILSSPSNGATNVLLPPSLVWNASTGAASYTLQVSENSSFTTFAYNQSGLAGTSQQIAGLSYSTTYYWRVSATNSYGTSEYSTTWNFTTEPPCPVAVTYEGKTYNTVLIGNQCWMKENLDVGTMIQGNQEPINNGVIEKYCYGSVPNNCSIYGGLYLWDEAMQYVITPGTQGICPSGWHIPTQAEFQTLLATVSNDGNALKAIGQGSGNGAGTNISGFSALLGGHRLDNGSFYDLGGLTEYWSSTMYDATYSYHIQLNANNSSILLNYYFKNFGFSIRCIKY
jgi:uncharacterized protein (TIGR02145 family)